MALIAHNVTWSKEKHKMKRIREKVFVCGWRIPEKCEFDQNDKSAYHVLVAEEDVGPIATGRITPQGEIGRIAVEPDYRNKEVYQALFGALVNIAKNLDLHDVSVHCELNGVEYYRNKGFKPKGHVFMDAGTPRQKMTCQLNRFDLPRVELTH